MARDRSLDDFLAGSDADEDSGDATDESPADAAKTGDVDAASDTSPATDDSDDDAPAPASGLDAGPAESTMAWSPDGAACEDCGTTVERRWRDDGALVCEDCKEW